MDVRIILFVLLLSSAAPAQSVLSGGNGASSGEVEQSLRRIVEPPLEAPSPRLELPSRRRSKPSDDALKLQVSRVVVTGNDVLSFDELKPELPTEGLRSLEELRQAADRVTELYRSKGYSLAFAYVPGQEVRDGVVEIAVVEGRVGRVVVEGNRAFSADFILDHLGSARGPGAPRLEEVERGLLLLNENPALRVSARARPGDEPGSTDLLLRVEEEKPVTLVFDYDNYGSEAVGEHRAGATVGFHDLWDAGHSLSLRGVSGLDSTDGDLGYARVEYALPLRSATRLSLYGALYDYEARGERTLLDPAGDGTVFGALASHAFVRGTELSLWGDVGIEFKDLDQEFVGIGAGEDRLRVLILGGRAEIADGWAGRWIASLRLRQGLGEFAGGLEEDDPEISRPGADGLFTALQLTLYRVQRVSSWIHAIGRVYGQWSDEPLLVSEQFALGGYGSVRGYPPFEFMGDRGYTASLEARFKLPFLEGSPDPLDGGVSAFDIFQLAAFIDTGEMIREDAAPGERRAQVLSGAGFGARVEYPGVGSLRVDIAWPLTDIAPSDDEEPAYYVSLILNLR